MNVALVLHNSQLKKKERMQFGVSCLAVKFLHRDPVLVVCDCTSAIAEVEQHPRDLRTDPRNPVPQTRPHLHPQV